MEASQSISSPSSPNPNSERYFFDYEGARNFEKSLVDPYDEEDSTTKIKFNLLKTKKFESFSNNDEQSK
jgi:hypothetical protein